jgi:cytochrome P450
MIKPDLTDIDLFVNGDPHAAWAWLRANEPVYWNPDSGPGGGFFALTRYDDLAAVYVDHTTYSSKEGTVMGGSFRSQNDTASGQMLICADPPDHRLLRQQVHQGFSNAMVDRIANVVSEYADRALTQLVADGGGDLAVDVAPELPAGVLAAMFGLSRDEAHYLLDLTRDMIGYRDAEYAGSDHAGSDHAGSDYAGSDYAASAQMGLVAAQVKIFDFLAELTEKRRREPKHDLPSMLLKSEVNGRPMTDGQILYNCLNVVVGGNETTPYTACAGTLALIEHPDQAERFYANPAVLGTAVEEILRWTSTNAYVGRTATRDTEIRGVPIKAGQRLTLWNASANRDEAKFDHADSFDVARDPNQHLAFGVGVHRCIGQTVARQEVTIFFQHLQQHGIRFTLAGPVERLASNFMLGTKHMPVSVVSGTR